MKTYSITIVVGTNLTLDEELLRTAIEDMILHHSSYDVDETTACVHGIEIKRID